MEEGSDAHMETDVSSTTDDVPETQEVTGSHGDVEMVLVVEKLKEEQSRSIDANNIQPQTSKTNSSPPKCEVSPHKEVSPQKIVIKPYVHDGNVPKKILLSSTNNCESQSKNSQILNKTSPVKQQPECSNSSTKIETKISPGKSLEKVVDRSPIKIAPFQRVIHKTPFKDTKLISKPPIKLKRNHEKHQNVIGLQDKSPVKIIHGNSEEINLQNTSREDAKLQEKSNSVMVEKSNKQAILQEKSSNNIQESTSKDIKSQENSAAKEKFIESTMSNKKLSETTSNKKLAEISPNRMIVETSPIKKVVETTSNIKSIELTSNNMLEELTSKNIPEPSSSKMIVDPTCNKNLVESSSNQNSMQTTTTVEVNVKKNPNNETSLEKTYTTGTNLLNSTDPIRDVPILDNPKVSYKISSHKKSVADNKVTKTVNAENKTDVVEHTTDEDVNDVSNVSQDSADITEKEHNKSISRELKSLIKSAKESKIISECTQLKSKTRKSRSQLDSSNTSINNSMEAEKVGNRRGSSNSQASNCSEKSDRAMKRSMRSHNPEFANKCKQFFSKVKDSDELMSEEETNLKYKPETGPQYTDSLPTSPKKKKVTDQPILGNIEKLNKLRSDAYCWRCHWTVDQEDNNKAHPPMRCTVCPRSYHYKCLSTSERKTPPEKNWVCPDCLLVLSAESSDTRSPAMKKTSLGMLCDLLKYALERMMDLNGVEPFVHPVDRTAFPDYDKYVVHPMDLSQMKQNIADGLYGSTEAFIADAQWILHNSIIFNTCVRVKRCAVQSKLTGGARALVRSCRAEMGEIEACPECYAAAHARRPTWFTDVCSTPHILLWAKLKGFPYWPAKGMTVNSTGLVDVRFFGAHDRAWVPAKDCYLFSEKDPNNFRNKRQDILDAMQEAEQHIRNISRKYGKFVYPPFKTQFEPTKITEQLKMMIPSFEGEVRPLLREKLRNPSPITPKVKRRSTSKGSKSSANDGDGSESEDTSTSSRTEPMKVDKEKVRSSEKVAKPDSPIVVNKSSTQPEESIVSKKRRRSNLEEARVMTVIETGVPEKKRKEETSTDQMEQDQQEPSSSKEDKSQLIAKEAEVTEISKNKIDAPKSKSKDEEEPPSSTTEEKESLRVTPIKLVALPRQNKQTPKLFTTTKIASKPDTPKEDDKTPQRPKSAKSDKSGTGEKSKEDKAKALKRRNSKSNKSLTNISTPKSSKVTDKKSDSNDSTSEKEQKPRENKKKETDAEANSSVLSSVDSPKQGSRDNLKFDDDISLAVLARERRRSNVGLPTISNVCSLSTTAQATATTSTPITSASQIEVTVEASSSSSIFTPTSTDSVLNMKDAVTKLQKLRDNTEPVVGRVGVRAFARMTSPSRNDNVEVEIKAEPIDLDEADEGRHSEKMDLMNACKLQPVNQAQSLRDVRINRVVVPNAAKKGSKVEARPRARKTFPQPRREDSGRSELNGKNSMVYIPIQPPATQPPVRPTRPVLPASRPLVPHSAAGNNAVNTVITPLKPSTSTLSSPSASASVVTSPAVQVSVPTVGQVPTAVHTVPLMTSVNGQWMFSLQPVMSVGGVDSSPPAPVINGLPERGAAPASAPATPLQNRATADNNTPNELPRLQQRPTLIHPFDAGPSPVHTPAAAGPATAKINQNASKLADFFRTLLEESLEKTDDPAALASSLRVQLEAARWRHSQEINEIKHNHELTLAEMRLTHEKDKIRVMSEVKRAAQTELEAAVKAAKSKQWCANCSQEAQFYCCWNTAYCDYPCQRAHWPQHFANCAQRSKDGNEDETNPPESRLQPQPDVLPKSAPVQTPALTVGGKVATTRVVTPQDAPAQKTQIIVSMVEDNSGNQTMKCVGTYKPNQAQGQMPPLIINKQLLNEDSSKKVVTSGGYLIVGTAGGNTTSVITPAPTRRPHTIQYFT